MICRDMSWCFVIFHYISSKSHSSRPGQFRAQNPPNRAHGVAQNRPGQNTEFHYISWYFIIFHDISWYVMIFLDISWYFMIFHDISLTFIRFHEISWSYVIIRDIYIRILWSTGGRVQKRDNTWYIVICHHVSWYLKILHDISLYFMIFHDISLYFMLFRYISWCCVIFHYIP